ncbi:hypothetical protein TSUD_181610 [Trifolium subterraneum]|uniref:Uncharacterized protein n=1 Tax=Trifolium subterraneum TaxID=3900 RepID=A0A2Z6NS78_TRISU|nr:hypothetical protein TSUD_181610 [Trifolium subterraneum]
MDLSNYENGMFYLYIRLFPFLSPRRKYYSRQQSDKMPLRRQRRWSLYEVLPFSLSTWDIVDMMVKSWGVGFVETDGEFLNKQRDKTMQFGKTKDRDLHN